MQTRCTPSTLAELEQQLARELALINYPPSSWVHPTHHQGIRVEDVVILGAGMCGLAAGFALRRKGIDRVRILDRNPAGFEGPWRTFARMNTLRSPKNLTGPAGDIPSLTFHAFFEAQFGLDAWEALDKIDRTLWMEYLVWYRKVLSLPVENGVEVTRIKPLGDLLQLTCKSFEGAVSETVLTRKVVIATGRSGQGAPYLPPWIQGIPTHLWAHSSDSIDFAPLRGKKVAVIGAGASAMDNAAEALEHGASSCEILVRRNDIPRINKLMGIGSPGFTAGFPLLSDEWRWRIMHYAAVTQTPPPRPSVQRVSRNTNAHFHFGVSVRSAAVTADKKVALTLSTGEICELDFLILGTGFSIDMKQPPGLIAGDSNIATWQHRYLPPADMQNPGLASSPYLAKDFAFMENEQGSTPWLRNLYCFNHAATLSLGKVSGDIPRVSDGAAWLAEGIAASFYTQDIDSHWNDLLAYETPELLGDEWTPHTTPLTPTFS